MPIKTHFLQATLLLAALGYTSGVWAETLPQLIGVALAQHPAVQAQLAQVSSAQSAVETAKWQAYPTPSVVLDGTLVSMKEDSQRAGTTLRLQQPLWTGGRLTAEKDKANAQVQVSQSVVQETQQQLALRVLQAFVDWQGAYLKVQAYQRSIATHQRLREQIERRIQQGALPESDLVLLLNRLSMLEADVAAAMAQQNTAIARMSQLLGQTVSASRLQQLEVPHMTVDNDANVMVQLAFKNDPSIRKKQAQASFQSAVVDERKADLWPEVYARAERQTYGGLQQSDTRLMIGLSSRLGAGLSNLSNVQAARAQQQAAVLEVNAQNQVLVEQILTDHALAMAAQARLKALTDTKDTAVKIFESYERQFLAGRKTWLDLLNMAREQTQTDVQLTDIQMGLLLASWRLAIYSRGVEAVVAEK